MRISGSTRHDLTVDLNDNALVLTNGRIELNFAQYLHLKGGSLTSTNPVLTIVTQRDSTDLFNIHSSIRDNGVTKVGLTITRDKEGVGHRGVAFKGKEANTFTGDVNVSLNTKLNLGKDNGVISVSGNMNVLAGAQVRVLRKGQIARKSTVRLKSVMRNPSWISFHGILQADHREQFYKLIVEGGGVFEFSGGDSNYKHGRREIMLDDLEITAGSLLKIKGWADKRDFFLVRKDSTHLDAALKRIDFVGYNRRTIGKRNYNKDYWEIYAVLPEPSAYGAALLGVGFGAVAWSRRRDGKSHKEAGGHFH